MGTKSLYSTPNPSANIIIFSAFGYFFPFSISLIYEADNPVSTPSCLRPNPFYYQKQQSFIPKILRKLNLPELDVSSGLLATSFPNYLVSVPAQTPSFLNFSICFKL